jgi:hypothetical protein
MSDTNGQAKTAKKATWRELLAGWRLARAAKRRQASLAQNASKGAGPTAGGAGDGALARAFRFLISGFVARAIGRARGCALLLAQLASYFRVELAWSLAGAALGLPLGILACVGSPAGIVWVDWQKQGAALTQEEAAAPGAGALAAWGENLTGSSRARWRAAEAPLSVRVSATSMSTCFDAGACLRLRTSPGQAVWATLTGQTVRWEPVGAEAARPAERDLAEIGSQSAVDWRLASALALVGATLGMLLGSVHGGALRAARREAGHDCAPNLPAWAAAAAMAEHLAIVAAAALVGMAATAVVMHFSWSDERWLAPESSEAIRQALSEPGSVNADALSWAARNDESLATMIDPLAAQSADGSRRQAALAACLAANLCARRDPATLADVARRWAGLPERGGLVEFHGSPKDKAAWAKRDRNDRAANAHVAEIFAGLFLVLFGGLGSVVIGGRAQKKAVAWLATLQGWSEQGRPVEERRELAQEASRAAKKAAKSRVKSGDPATRGSVNKKAPRI